MVGGLVLLTGFCVWGEDISGEYIPKDILVPRAREKIAWVRG